MVALESKKPSTATQKPQARGFQPAAAMARAQAQALNQQPDSIPAMMKPGEYVLPPDTVQALGGPQALDATVAQTHTPANAGAMVPRGFEPKHFFNNGGLVQDEEQKPKPISPSNIYPQGSPSAGADVYGGAIEAAKSAVSAAANPQGGQPLAKGAAQVFGQREALQQQGRERWDASVAARQPAAHSAPQPPTTDEANTRLSQQITAAQNQQQERTAAAQRTQAYDAQATPVARGLPPSASDANARIAAQVANAQQQREQGIAAVQRGQAYDSITQQQRQQAYDTWQSNKEPWFMPTPQHDTRLQAAEKTYTDMLAGRSASTTPAPAAPAPAKTSQAASSAGAAPDRTPEQLAKQLGGLDRQHAQNVQLQTAARTPEQARAEAVQQTAGQPVQGLSGVYQHGRGQYSDNPQGMGFTPGFTGQPSAQNLAAADALAGQQQAQSAARVAAAQQEPAARGFTGFEMPRQENAYEREVRQRERNRIMGMLQTPLTGDPRRDLTASQRQQLVAQLGQESQERQSTERNMFGLAGQQLNAETQRYSTDASTAVGMARNAIDQQRVGLDGQRLGLDAQQQQEQSTARGFDIRQAQRKQSFQEAWEKGTKEQREQLQQMYPDLMPTDKEKPRFEVVRGRNNPVTGESGQDYVLRMNPNGTVEQVPVEGMGQGQPKPMPKNKGERVVGNLYVDNNGQLVKWTEKGAVSAQ